jgi:hypothetical protein
MNTYVIAAIIIGALVIGRDGFIAAGPSDMTRVAGDLAEDYAEEYPSVPLPCDGTGREA